MIIWQPSFIGISIPAFFFGLILIKFFSFDLKLLPITGMVTVGAGYTGIKHVLDVLWHLLLPTVVLALLQTVTLMRYTRSAMLEVLDQDYIRTAMYSIEVSPSSEHLLGTDEMGRDVYARLLYGGRVSMAVGILASLAEIAIGVVMGSIAGFYGGKVDAVIMRITDIIMCFPFFVVAIALAAIVDPSMINLIFIIATNDDNIDK